MEEKHASTKSPHVSRKKSASYKEYHQRKVRKRRNSKKATTSIGLLCSREYLSNKFNWLRIFVLIVTLLLLFVCVLYGFGGVLTLELEDFWCDKYNWTQIVQINQANNASRGIGGCYTKTTLEFQFNKVFSTDVNDNTLTVTTNIHFETITKSMIFFIICMILLYLFLCHTLKCVVDCKKTVGSQWYVPNIEVP